MVRKLYRVAAELTGGALTDSAGPSFLAMPYPATQVTTPPGAWLVDPELMVFSQNTAARVQTYTVTSADVSPTIAQLKTAAPPPPDLGADLALPASYQTKALKQIAQVNLELFKERKRQRR